MPYTERSKQNLINEGIPLRQIYVIGNPIHEVICDNIDKIDTSPILKQLEITKDNYFLVTMHRTENVDNPEYLQILLDSLCEIEREYGLPIIISTHPHTKLRLSETFDHCFNDNIKFLNPFGFFDFVKLELGAHCIITDSGTVQEECSILNIPNITIRNTTERPETQEYGSNIVTGINQDNILNGVKTAITLLDEWEQIPEYNRVNVSKTVAKILMSI
jgi:UDP-N-acetylglucosamine 2-epimerase (non-hydrolysing)